jgi:hypothetical protein
MYRTCAHPDCTVPFRRCRIHHIIWWTHHGDTDLANLVPLCGRHHHDVHEGGWQLTMTPDRIITLTTPDGTHYYTGNTTNRDAGARTHTPAGTGIRTRTGQAAGNRADRRHPTTATAKATTANSKALTPATTRPTTTNSSTATPPTTADPGIGNVTGLASTVHLGPVVDTGPPTAPTTAAHRRRRSDSRPSPTITPRDPAAAHRPTRHRPNLFDQADRDSDDDDHGDSDSDGDDDDRDRGDA